MELLKNIIFIAALLITLDQVNGECFELVQQYYECKNLIMRAPNLGHFPPSLTYQPDSSIAGNILDDTFYQNLNLKEKTFDEAMDLFWQIYNETNNCKSDFCKCVSTGIIDQYKYGRENQFSLFFLNRTNFEQVKIIVSEFINKYQTTISSYTDLEEFFKAKTHSNQTLPTLANFCMKYEYTDERFIYYKDSNNCYTDEIDVHNCKWEVMVFSSNYSVKIALTNQDLEELLSCDLVNAKTCGVEKKRFYTLTNWPQLYPKLVWSGNSLKTYIDVIIDESLVLRPTIDFRRSVLQTTGDTIHLNNWNMEKSFNIKSDDFEATCLDSPHLRIDCQWLKQKNKNTYYLALANFTFINRNIISKYPIRTVAPTKNQEMVNARNEQSDNNSIMNLYFFQIIADYNVQEIYYLDDFGTNMHAFINATQFSLYLPKSVWDNSRGAFVDGSFDVVPTTTKPITTTKNTNNSSSRRNILPFSFYISFLIAYLFSCFLRK